MPTNLTFTKTYSPVRQLESTDPAQGGVGAIMNAQAQSLGNRTDYLKNLLDSGWVGGVLVDLHPYAGGIYTVPPGEKGNLYFTDTTGDTVTVQIPDASAADDGTVLAFFLSGRGGAYMRIIPYSATPMFRCSEYGTPDELHLWDGGLVLKKFAGDTKWTVVSRIGGYRTGTIVIAPDGYPPTGAWFECNGATLPAWFYTELATAMGVTGGTITLPTVSTGISGFKFYIHV